MMDLNSYGLPTAGGPAPSSRTLDRAGSAAEKVASRRQLGLETECPRKLGGVTPQRCAELYRTGMSPCVSTYMGRCSLGMIEDQRQPKGENTMSYKRGHCANPACENHTKYVALYTQNRLCYACHKAALAGKLVWPPQSDQAEPFEKTEALPVQVEPQKAGATAEAERDRSDHASGVSNLPPDFSRPFSLGGFEFDPGFTAPPTTPPTVRLSASGDLHFSASAFKIYHLSDYAYARVIPDRTRKALFVQFSSDIFHGSRHLSEHKKSPRTPKISLRAVLRLCPGLVGKHLNLRETDIPGAFIAVLDGEAA